MPRKEAQKRKNDDVSNGPGVSGMEPFTMSTSTFLDQKGIAWNSLATTFGCEEVKDESILMSELLSLCNFWGESEPVFEDRDDNCVCGEKADSDYGLENFEKCNPSSPLSDTKQRFLDFISSSSTMISNLHFNSTLCLKSNSGRDPGKLSETTCQLPICACPSTSTETHQCLSVKEKCLSDEKRLESAFMGIMDDDNEMSRDGVPSETVANDFWSSVQF